VSAAFHPGMHGTTFGGGPLACAVACTFVRTLKKHKLLEHVVKMGDYFHKALLGLKARHPQVGEVRGLGLMLAAQLDSTDLAKAVVKQMLECGFVINRTNDNVLRFLPPFIVEKQHVDQLVSALDQVLSANTASPAATRPATRSR
jgi:acetylornithine aminotransferase/acetylornithine/N-succinyldiaminopimelate aminotransferase